MERVLITGANRGIGLELARQYLERGDLVLATARNLGAAVDLRTLAAQHGDRCHPLALDVTDEAGPGPFKLEGTGTMVIYEGGVVRLSSPALLG